MAKRPTTRKKYTQSWNDFSAGYQYTKSLRTFEHARGASWRLHDPESPVKKVFNPKKQKAQKQAAASTYWARQGVSKKKVVYTTKRKDPKASEKPIYPRTLQAAVNRIGTPNRNAPVQKLKPTYYRKKKG